jgi:hypothetical protein
MTFCRLCVIGRHCHSKCIRLGKVVKMEIWPTRPHLHKVWSCVCECFTGLVSMAHSKCKSRKVIDGADITLWQDKEGICVGYSISKKAKRHAIDALKAVWYQTIFYWGSWNFPLTRIWSDKIEITFKMLSNIKRVQWTHLPCNIHRLSFMYVGLSMLFGSKKSGCSSLLSQAARSMQEGRGACCNQNRTECWWSYLSLIYSRMGG